MSGHVFICFQDNNSVPCNRAPKQNKTPGTMDTDSRQIQSKTLISLLLKTDPVGGMMVIFPFFFSSITALNIYFFGILLQN